MWCPRCQQCAERQVGTVESYDLSIAVLGLILVVLGIVMFVADSGGLSKRMPTPRGLAALPLLIGVALIVADVMN